MALHCELPISVGSDVIPGDFYALQQAASRAECGLSRDVSGLVGFLEGKTSALDVNDSKPDSGKQAMVTL
jgi:hypothetical protein